MDVFLVSYYMDVFFCLEFPRNGNSSKEITGVICPSYNLGLLLFYSIGNISYCRL